MFPNMRDHRNRETVRKCPLCRRENLLSLAFLFVVIFIGLWMMLSPNHSSSTGLVIMVPAILGLLIRASLFSKKDRREIHNALIQSQCPACGYSLKGLSRDKDGFTVCPECGASWRMDRANQVGKKRSNHWEVKAMLVIGGSAAMIFTPVYLWLAMTPDLLKISLPPPRSVFIEEAIAIFLILVVVWWVYIKKSMKQ